MCIMGSGLNRDSDVLQWVHGRITVVMQVASVGEMAGRRASMGPRSDNRGYARGPARAPQRVGESGRGLTQSWASKQWRPGAERIRIASFALKNRGKNAKSCINCALARELTRNGRSSN